MSWLVKAIDAVHQRGEGVTAETHDRVITARLPGTATRNVPSKSSTTTTPERTSTVSNPEKVVTSVRGAKTTTTATPEKVTTVLTPDRVSTLESPSKVVTSVNSPTVEGSVVARTSTTNTTVKEDAGATVSFVIKIRGGRRTTETPPALCQ